MNKKLHYLLLLLASIVGLQATAAVPSGYYNNAKGKNDQALMAALHAIIDGHTKRSYQQLWTYFKTTDCNGDIIIDRYSTTQYTYSTDQCGSYNGVGDCYNREHSIPNSWWGGDDSDTAYTDLHHMFPVDGFVNSKRGNYPLGDCNTGTVYGTGMLGSCAFAGYSGTVFEVADEYKGDFARVFFYFATRYMTRISNYTSGTGSVVFTASTYLGLTNWAINQLLEWHRNDPVSSLETTRNDAVYGIQHNRNPFIDNPELVEYIWGNMKGNAWNGGGTPPTPTPTLTSPTNGSTVNVGTNTGNGVSMSITVKGSNLTKSLAVSVSGTGFSVTPTSITAASANNGTNVTVSYNGTATSATGTLTISSSEVSTTVNLTASYNSGGGEPGEEIVETWEGCSTGGYWTQDVQGKAFSWAFSNAGIWDDTNKNGARSCRFGKNSNSFIAMNEDVTGGASKVTFYAANWGSDATPTVQLQYSTNGGNSWTTAGTCTLNSTWKQYSFDLNVTGNVRFKILQTAGSRFNIDDIAITGNASAPVEPTVAITSIAAVEAEQGGTSTIVTGTVTSEDNTENINLTVEGNFELSLNRSNWSRTLTLDPSGEVFYVRLANTQTVGEYYGTITASTSQASAYADVRGTVNAKPITIGDVNMDGSINIADVTTLIDYLLGSPVSPFDPEAADVANDGAINIADVTALIDRLLSQPATSTVLHEWDAYPAIGGIIVENYSGENIEVYDMEGNCCAVMMSQGECSIELPAGIYVVASDNRSRKVVVK